MTLLLATWWSALRWVYFAVQSILEAYYQFHILSVTEFEQAYQKY